MIYRMYFTDTLKDNIYKRIFLFTNFTLLGMMFSFPLQGYALFSIIFSTLFLFASYFLAWFVFKYVPQRFRDRFSYRCIKAALCYMVISSIGPWAVGGVMAILGKASIWYKLSIYFYLHFQYNGWFILALTGILLFIAEKTKVAINKKKFRAFFLLMNAGIILSFFLSVLWTNPPVVFYWLAAAGAVLQVLACLQFFEILKKSWKKIHNSLQPIVAFLLELSGILLVVKVLLQLSTALPFFAELSFLYTDFVIGYLHWTFLGVVSLALFAFLHHFDFLKISRTTFWIYFCGFSLSEALIFYKGTSLWLHLVLPGNYSLWLVLISALIPLSVGVILFQNITSSRSRLEK
ncbi:hypothetical protein [Zunongwangia sp. H14]|uniref:hypothetical protein n=1 Tax=Zunongwangia sp. H14 TaxID=3240792 RepID=UPI00356AA49B